MANDSDHSDPFRRRDSRSVWGKSERRDSPRARATADINVEGAEGKTNAEVSVSLNGLFIENADTDGLATTWIGRPATVALNLHQASGTPEVVQLSGTFERPHHRDDGALIRMGELNFESERALARFLDETSSAGPTF